MDFGLGLVNQAILDIINKGMIVFMNLTNIPRGEKKEEGHIYKEECDTQVSIRSSETRTIF